MMEKAHQALKKLKAQHKDDPNIDGFSVGYKERNGKPINKCAVKVYVKQKFAKSVLQDHRILPNDVDGIIVDVVVRDFQLHRNPNSKFDPLIGGIKIANGNNDDVYGTIGAIINTTSGDYYILSNWHVLYGRADANDGEAVYQPRKGILFEVAKTSIGIINKTVDCALARTNNKRLIDQSILEIAPAIYGFEKNIKTGTEVVKYGVNGKAIGEIVSVTKDHTFPVPWQDDPHEVEDQLEITQIDGQPFNVDLGDSGSLWVTNEANPKAVGLHFAGETNKFALANPIYQVVDKLKNSGYEIQF